MESSGLSLRMNCPQHEVASDYFGLRSFAPHWGEIAVRQSGMVHNQPSWSSAELTTLGPVVKSDQRYRI